MMDPAVLLFILRILIALTLYAFLALTLILLWRDMNAGGIEQAPIPEAHLLTLSGDGLSDTYPLDEVNLLGRAKDNTLTLPEATVSAYHARISCRQGTWWLEDLGSRNGTVINDIPVVDPTVLTFGDEIHLGSIIVRFCSGPVPAGQEEQEHTQENELE